MVTTTSGQSSIRGIDIDKLAKGYAEEDIVLKSYLKVTSTSARDIRWYQKTAGFITPTSYNTGAVANPVPVSNYAPGARPSILEQSWTRQESYVFKFIMESPLFSDEDIKDTDIDVLSSNIHDLTRSINHQVDQYIYNTITENQVPANTQSVAAIAAWNTASFTNVDCIRDIMALKGLIRKKSYDPEGAVIIMTPDQHQYLLDWLITIKGSSIPIFSSSAVEKGVVMNLLGCKIVVNLVAVSGTVVMFIPQRSATWKGFTPTTAVQIPDLGIGVKFRIWEEGQCLLTDPKSVAQLTSVGV